MVNQGKGLDHLHMRKRIHEKHEPIPHPNKFKRDFDKFMYAIVIIGPLTNLPQLLTVWMDQNAAGVSPLSWALFSIISFIWIIYGILHKEKHIIFMSAALAVIQAFIAIGAVLYG